MNSTRKSRNWILEGRTTNPALQNLTNLGPHTFNCCSFGSVPCKGTCPKATFFWSSKSGTSHYEVNALGNHTDFPMFLQFYKIVLPWILKNPWKKSNARGFFSPMPWSFHMTPKIKIVRYLKTWCRDYVIGFLKCFMHFSHKFEWVRNQFLVHSNQQPTSVLKQQTQRRPQFWHHLKRLWLQGRSLCHLPGLAVAVF